MFNIPPPTEQLATDPPPQDRTQSHPTKLLYFTQIPPIYARSLLSRPLTFISSLNTVFHTTAYLPSYPGLQLPFLRELRIGPPNEPIRLVPCTLTVPHENNLVCVLLVPLLGRVKHAHPSRD